ncbi:MAG: YgiQ family radical SAM protein [Spirochaetaceae bacterium 4572_7]|nr:MAG: YgiQ family radical SAM protein [Spirochaetaceae bacterium 4572_7]
MNSNFLPINRKDMDALGWDRPDFVLITGDAYVDHPSFGTAVISRLLEKEGFKVAILAQPNWKDLDSFKEFGKPRFAFLINGGNMDSMVSNYTAAKKTRKSDVYSPGGKIGLRPDRAAIVYSAAIKQIYKKVPIILGGIETSLRRMAHYDYWSNKIRRAIILDAKADLVIYGMGEKQILEIGKRFKAGLSIKQMKDIPGTTYRTHTKPNIDGIFLPSFKEILDNKRSFAESFNLQHLNTDPYVANRLFEEYPGEWVVQNSPAIPLNREELDMVHELPYARSPHPSYDKLGGVKAIDEVQFSLIINRGCYGGCSFCALTFHQGRIVQSRSPESIVNEAKEFIKHPDFKGYIHDVGGPTANFTKPACFKQGVRGACPTKQCLAPTPCKMLEVDHNDYLALLRELRSLPGVKKVFIRSGIRFDYLMLDDDDSFFRELVEHHISGQLKVAPEHVSDNVLKLMGKPENSVFSSFAKKYKELNDEFGKNQFLVPYFISSHPGATLNDAVELAEYLRDTGLRSDQVQDFIPTPGTLSTAMFYSGYDPSTMKRIESALTIHDKALQRALLQYKKPQNRELVQEALILCHREDLIGSGDK